MRKLLLNIPLPSKLRENKAQQMALCRTCMKTHFPVTGELPVSAGQNNHLCLLLKQMWGGAKKWMLAFTVSSPTSPPHI